MLDYVCAVSGGVHSTSPMLDLTQLEENDIPHTTVAILPRTNKVTLLTMETRLHVDRFEEIFRLACEAGVVLHAEMQAATQSKTRSISTAMKTVARTAGDSVDRDGDERME